MHDAPFYLSMFAVSAIISQIPDVPEFRELSATVILGILFWYTLTRINTGIKDLTVAISDLKETIIKESDRHANPHFYDKD